MLNLSDSVCEVTHSKFGIWLGVILAVGTYVTYIPQLIALVRRRDPEGLSFGTMFLACCYNWSVTLNAGILQWSTIMCCKTVSFLDCQILLLSLHLIVANLISNFPIFVIMFFFFKFDGTEKNKREFRINVAMLIGFILIVAVSTGAAVIIARTLGENSHTESMYAYGIGIASNFLVIIQWAPQIYETWKIKSAGSLSILMLLLQAPGCMLLVYEQIFEYHVNWSTWGSYLINAIEMTFLLTMCIIFEIRIWLKKKRERKSPEAVDSPLLKEEAIINTNE